MSMITTIILNIMLKSIWIFWTVITFKDLYRCFRFYNISKAYDKLQIYSLVWIIVHFFTGIGLLGSYFILKYCT